MMEQELAAEIAVTAARAADSASAEAPAAA